MNNYQLAIEQDIIASFEYHMVKRKGSSANTIKAYLTDIRVFFSYLDKKNIEYTKVTPMVCDKYILSNRDIKAFATVDRYLVSLNKFYEYLSKIAGMIEYNPFKDVERLELSKAEKANLQKQKEILTKEELELFESAIIDEVANYKTNKKQDRYYLRNPIREYAMILIMMNTGCRVNEVCGLTFNDVDLAGRTVTFRNTKNGITITRDISSKTMLAIKKYISIREHEKEKCDCVFIGSKGNKINTNTMNKSLEYYIIKAGLDKHFTSHCIRSTFATLYHEQCKDIEMVKEALNHQSVKTTMRYIQAEEYKKNVKTGFSLV